jgi:flagellar biosynthesis protein FliQ
LKVQIHFLSLCVHLIHIDRLRRHPWQIIDQITVTVTVAAAVAAVAAVVTGIGVAMYQFRNDKNKTYFYDRIIVTLLKVVLLSLHRIVVDRE